MDKNKESTIEVVRPFGETEIEAHAAKCGGRRNLREVPITSGDYTFVYLLKKPSRSVMQAITSAEQKKNITQVQNLIMGCVLEGDKDAYEHDGGIYVRLLESVTVLVEEAESDIKKL